MPNRRILIALGSNLPGTAGNSAEMLQNAVQKIHDAGLLIRASSELYVTPAFPKGNGPDFVNAAVLAETSLSPKGVLESLHGIEEQMARVRGQRWQARTIDLDLLAYEDLVLPDAETFTAYKDLSLKEQMQTSPDQLILPHPRLQDRSFVLVPLKDVAPDWHHPVLNQTVQSLHDALPQEELAEIKMLSGIALFSPDKASNDKFLTLPENSPE